MITIGTGRLGTKFHECQRGKFELEIKPVHRVESALGYQIFGGETGKVTRIDFVFDLETIGDSVHGRGVAKVDGSDPGESMPKTGHPFNFVWPN